MPSLYDYAKCGSVRATMVIAPPRSCSTALSIALAQSPDIHLYIHEPFANGYDGVPSASKGNKIIGRSCRRIRTTGMAPSPCRRLLIKEMSTHLGLRTFRRLCSACDSTLVMLRWPLLQLRSVARACAWADAGHADAFRFDFSRFLSSEWKRFTASGEWKYYFIQPWRALRVQMEYLARASAGDIPSPVLLAMDTEFVRARPKELLRSAARRLHLRFTDQMLSGWDRRKIANMRGDGWAKRAFGARGLYRPERQAVPLEAVSQAWHPALLEAIETYLFALMQPGAVRPVSASSTRRLFLTPAGSGRRFADSHPESCYALAATAPEPCPELMRTLRRRNPDHAMTFDVVDELVRRLVMNRL